MSELTATIIDIQRLSTEDGPGLRTTVFLKGCSLACTWCHNPESISFERQVQWLESNRCIGCGLCIEACPADALSMTENGIQINREVCGGCATCVAVCPTAAMELKGEVWERDALIAELVKDVSYIGKDGGVTFSGGEALMQSEFVTCALKRLQEMGIGTAVDTAGLVPAHALLGALPYTDVLLYDLKIFDREKHIEYTGAPNDLILKNIIAAADYAREHGTPEIWIRTPIIPGATDSDDNINHIGKFIAAYLDDAISRWELCAFNNLCLNKYERLGEEWDFAGISLVHAEEMEHLLDVAKDSGANPDKILWTGSTFVEK